MATKYTVEDLLITKEDTNGDIMPDPTVIRLCVNKFDLMEAPTFDEKGCLLSDGKIKVESGTEFSGGATIDMDANSLPIILTHVLGAATTVEDATTSTWAATTQVTKGDVVNVTGDTWSLVATSSGTTGDTEPTPTEQGEKVIDGSVIWVAQPLLLKYTFEMNTSCPTFTVEYKLSDGTNNFYKQFRGVEISQFPLAIDGSTSVPELGLDFNTASAVDSESGEWTNDLLSETGVVLVEFPKDYYGGACELTKIFVNGVLVDDFDSVSMTIDKQLSSVKRLNCKKIADRDLKIEGEMVKDFTIEDYNAFKSKDTFSVKFDFDTLVGAECQVTFPLVKSIHTDPNFETKDMVLISPTITATDTPSTNIVSAICVAPSLMSNGTIVGNGAY